MALYPGLMLTEAGIQMIAESQLNETKLIITKAKIGDGDLPVGHDISKMTDVLSPKLEAPFSSFKNLGNGQIDIKFAVSNAELEAGFFAKEIGIFASLEDGTETLYAYTNAGNKTDWIADKTKLIDSQIIECQLVIGNAPNVVINITDKAYALADDLAKHEESAESHKDLFDNKADKLENGHGIVRSVNNQYADDNGNVNLSGIDTGMIIPFAGNGDIPAGFLLCNGASVLRDTYPDLYKVIGTTYGAVDSTHFNLPDLIGRFAEGSESAGGYKEAGQPPSLTVRYIIKAFAGASVSSTDIEITKVANDVADRANRDLSNLSEKGRKAFFPSDTFISIDISGIVVSNPDDIIHETSSTAPANGFLNIACNHLPNCLSSIQLLNHQTIATGQFFSAEAITHISIPTRKGQRTKIIAHNISNKANRHCRFYYAEGEVTV